MNEPFVLMWTATPADAEEVLRQLVGAINTGEFRGHPHCTLLAHHPTVRPFRQSDGSLSYEVQLRFIPVSQPPSVSMHEQNDPNRRYPWPEVDFTALIPAGAEVQPA